MEFNKRFTYLIIFCLSLCYFPAFAQKDYTFKPWKDKNKIQVKDIVFIIDKLGSEESYQAIEKITNELCLNLNKSGYQCNSVRETDSKIETKNGKSLYIKLSLAAPAYVQLKGLTPVMPLCNRIKFEQKNYLPKNPKHKIETIISISIDKNDEAIEPLAKDLSERIIKNLI